jgi:polyphosphate glucokinase
VNAMLGIDVGGSSLRLARVDVAAGRVIDNMQTIPMPPGARPEEVLQALAASPLLATTTGMVGIGLPSVVEHGVAHTAAHLDASWVGLDVGRLFFERTGRSACVLNDGDAAGLAEMRFGVGAELLTEQPNATIIVLTLGTGIGSALFTGGKLWPNTELGHLYLPGISHVDGEGWAAASVRTTLGLDWADWCVRLDDYLAELRRLLRPDWVILGGAVSAHADEWLPLLLTDLRLRPAALRGQAGVIGAARAAKEATIGA